MNQVVGDGDVNGDDGGGGNDDRHSKADLCLHLQSLLTLPDYPQLESVHCQMVLELSASRAADLSGRKLVCRAQWRENKRQTLGPEEQGMVTVMAMS